jgi:hypothetical protein
MKNTGIKTTRNITDFAGVAPLYRIIANNTDSVMANHVIWTLRSAEKVKY